MTLSCGGRYKRISEFDQKTERLALLVHNVVEQYDCETFTTTSSELDIGHV